MGAECDERMAGRIVSPTFIALLAAYAVGCYAMSYAITASLIEYPIRRKTK